MDLTMSLKRKWAGKVLGAVAHAALLLSLPLASRAGVMMEGFYPNVPSPAAGTSSAPWWWDNFAAQANTIRLAGFTAVWVPPVLKGASGGYSAGYDPFDDYDMGSKNEAGTTPTRFGTREQLERCCAMLRANGLDIYLDIVDNHRAGDDGQYNFKYVDAYGNANSGRFQKGPGDFHWAFGTNNLPEDPDVPSPGDDQAYQFGRDLAPINGFKGSDGIGYAYEGLEKAGDWMTKALDAQGFRLDDVKGISTDWMLPFLNYGAMANKYAVGEYYDSNVSTLNYWVQTSMQNRASVFDFALRGQIASMCNSGGYYDMSQLDHAGLTGVNPGGSVTFVENHDTDGSSPITQNKMLGYALILTSEGYPCVYYRDWSTDAGCYGLKTGINNLVWIHEHLAAGYTQQRYKSTNVFAYERMGGNHLLVGLNDNGASDQYCYMATGFYPYTQLHDYTGHKPDVYCDGSGGVTLDIPADVNGGGYVCYAPVNQTGTTTVNNYATTQEYAGAQDLDIKPADNTATVQVCRLWVAAGKPITGALYYDNGSWTSSTSIYLELDDPTLANVASGSFGQNTSQPARITTTAKKTGWYVFKIRSYNTPTANAKPAYWLQATYTAPQK